MKFFRVLYGSWPNWYGELDDGDILYVRIRHGKVFIGTGKTEDTASDNADLIREGVAEYAGVTDIIEALIELREMGYYFVPPTSRDLIK
jgi:hypothetical protein